MNFHAFLGDSRELRWNWKDLESLRAVIPLVQNKRVAVQAGGCLGVLAKELASHFEVVYTFEPSPLSFPLLVQNVMEENVIKIQSALGCRPGVVLPVSELRGNDGKSEFHCGMTYMKPDEGFIPTIRLDDLNLSACDLMYLDVEGYELFAIQGAKSTIMKYKPVIACEINRGIEYYNHTGDDLRTYLTFLGYKFHSRHRSDEAWIPR